MNEDPASRRRFNPSIVVLDSASTFPWPNSSFSAVFSTDTYHPSPVVESSLTRFRIREIQ